MRSSISSSEPERWAAFWRTALLAATGSALLVYGFIVIVDPWGMLPLSPDLPRVPISTNARYSFPALAVSPAFDSAIFGTSAVRLLRPETLDPLFHARFANLSMNSATAYEQLRMLELFLAHHPRPRVVMIGLDIEWCLPGDAAPKFPPADFQPQPFPDWMYSGSSRWRGYLQVMNLYAVQEAVNQFAVMIGWKQQRYGSDGYTRFVPDDRLYDLARARTHIAEERASDEPPPPDFDPQHAHFATLDLLRRALGAVPAGTRKRLFFVPYHVALQGAPGSFYAVSFSACKRQLAELARAVPNLVLADFMIPSAITKLDENYWDAHHYRIGIADRLARGLALADAGRASPSGDFRLLLD